MRTIRWSAPLTFLTLIAGLLVFAAPAQAATYAVQPPTGLKASRTGSTFVQLAWNRPSGSVDGYSIQYSTSSTMSNPKYRVPSGGATTEVQINNLEPTKKYWFRIRAKYKGKDVSDWSGKYSTTTSAYSFGKPSTPSVSRIRKDSFRMSWSEVPNASRYRIELTKPGGAKVWFYTAASETDAYIGRGGTVTTADGASSEGHVVANSSYTVRVRALEAKVDENGDPFLLTAYSNTRSLKTHPTHSVYPVGDMRIDSVVKNEITLSWQLTEEQPNSATAEHTADKYRIQAKTGSTTRTLDTTVGDSSIVTFSKSGGRGIAKIKKFCNGASTCSSFAAGSKYTFRVAAYRGSTEIGGYTDWTENAVATNQLISIPQDLRVDGRTDRSLTFSWVEAPGATSYRMQVKKGSTSGTTRYVYDICDTGTAPKENCTKADGRVSYTVTQFKDNQTGASTAIKGNETYHVRVAAQKGGAAIQDRASEYQNSYTKGVTNGWPLEIPDNLRAVTSTGNSVTMSWDEPEGVGTRTPAGIRYRFQVARNADMSGSKTYPVTPVITKGGTTQYRITGLAEETTYYFRIRAVDANNSATFSDYTAEGKPATGRTTSARGSLTGTLTLDDSLVAGSTAECDLGDYRLAAYWGDEVEQRVPARTISGTSATFRIDQLRLGGYFLRYEYIGTENCVSPWVSTEAYAKGDSHKLKPSTKYTVAENQNRTIDATKAFKGVRASGVVRTNGAARVGALVSATGAPMNAANTYRETHAVTVSGSGGAWELNGLWPGTKYRFDLKYNNAEMTIWRNQISASDPGTNFNVNLCTTSGCTPSSTVPSEGGAPGGGVTPPGDGYSHAIPTNLRSTAQTASSLTLAWNAVPDAPHYRVQYSKNSNMSGASYQGVSGSSTSLTLTGLSAGTRYYVRVAVVEAGNGGKLSDYTGTPYPSAVTSTSGGTTPPGDGYSHAIPTNLRSTAQTASSLTLAWNAVPDAPHYRVQYSKNSNMSGASYANVSGSSTSLTLTGLSAGTRYYVRVAVVEAGNGGKLSDYTGTPYPSVVTAAAGGTTPPGDGYAYAIPTGLAAAEIGTASLKLTWNAVPDAPHYRVQYSTNANMSKAKYADVSGSSTSLLLTDLTPGTRHYVRVAVVEAGNGGKLSDYTGAPYPSVVTSSATYAGGYRYAIPTGPEVASASSTSLDVSWGAVPAAPWYRVQYSKNADMSGASYANTGSTSTTLTGLEPGTTYYVRVAVVQAGNGGKLSDYTATPYPTGATA